MIVESGSGSVSESGSKWLIFDADSDSNANVIQQLTTNFCLCPSINCPIS